MGDHPDVPLRRYTDQRIDALHHEVDLRITGLQQEIDGREQLMQAEIDRRIAGVTDLADNRASALESRLESMNEFRASLSDQRSRMVTTDVFTTTVASLKEARELALIAAENRIEALEKAIANQRGRQAQTTAIIASVIVLLIHIKGQG
jgi:hypothetical protein